MYLLESRAVISCMHLFVHSVKCFCFHLTMLWSRQMRSLCDECLTWTRFSICWLADCDALLFDLLCFLFASIVTYYFTRFVWMQVCNTWCILCLDNNWTNLICHSSVVVSFRLYCSLLTSCTPVDVAERERERRQEKTGRCCCVQWRRENDAHE